MSTTPDSRTIEVSSDARFWATFAHLGTLLGYLVGLGHFIPPLIVYLTKRDEDEFIADQARESLNFQINVVLAQILGILLCVTGIGMCVGVPLLILTGIGHLVFVLIAGIKSYDGNRYRYPISLRPVG